MKISIFSVELKVGTPIGNYWLLVVTEGSRATERWWNCLGLDHRSEGITRYTNAPMMVFVPEGTVVATGGRFVKMLSFFVDNACQALLADKLGSSGMAAGFGKLSKKKHHQKFKKPPNIHKNAK